MKKLSVLLVAMAVAVSASAGVNLKASRTIKSNKIMPKTEMVKSTVKVNDLKSKTQMRATIADPEGEAKTYLREGKAIYVSNGYLYTGEQTKRIDMVYGENGKVYMKDLLYGTGANFGDYWVEGQLNEDGTEIVVPMGQSIYYSDYYDADVVLGFGQTEVLYDETGSPYLALTVDERVTEAVYTIEGDVITLQGTDGPDEFIDELSDYEAYGLCAYWTDDLTFAGIEWNTVFTETEAPVSPTVITEIPEGCTTYVFYRNSACIYNSFFGIGETVTDGKFTVAFDETNGDVYIQNPAWWHDYYNCWVKGTYDAATGIISIPTGQFLSWNEEYEYGVILGWGMTYVYEDGVDEETGEPNYYLGYELDERTTEIQLMFDGENIFLLGCEGDINADFPECFNALGLFTYYSDDLSMTSLEFTNGEEAYGYIVNLVPAVPANPSADEWYDCGDESGYSRFYFTLPDEDVDGNKIEPECLSYSIFVDNVVNGVADPEIFHFTGDDYTFDLDYDADITEVGYDLYSNAVDFHDYFVYMYRTNMPGYEPLFTENIGIQVYYTVNGVKNASDLVWLYETPEPEDPHMTGYWLVMVQADGTEEFVQLNLGANGDYITAYDVIYPLYYNVGNFYFMIDGVAYGADVNGTDAVSGNAMENPLTEGNETYQVGVGYSYVLGVHLIIDDNTGEVTGYAAYVAKGSPVSVDELNASKTVANVRYFNVAGQEVAQPEGIAIKVITYTDGSKSAVKVVK